MDVYDAIYSVLDANGNKIKGRTTIQKIIYLSSKEIPDLDVPPYKAHYYGPFSPGVGWALEKMVSYSFLYEAITPVSIYEGHTYGLTEDGVTISKKVKENHKDMFKEVAKIVNQCKKLCELKAAPLSYASKIHYLYLNEPKSSMAFENAVEYAKKLGWNVSEDSVKQGESLLRDLNLDKIS